ASALDGDGRSGSGPGLAGHRAAGSLAAGGAHRSLAVTRPVLLTTTGARDRSQSRAPCSSWSTAAVHGVSRPQGLSRQPSLVAVCSAACSAELIERRAEVAAALAWDRAVLAWRTAAWVLGLLRTVVTSLWPRLTRS